MIIILPGERPMSWNKLYAATYWRKRNDEAIRVHTLVKIATRHVEVKFKNKVAITVTGFFDHHPTDSDNICDKFYIDGLRHSVIEDDTMRWVDSAKTQSRIDKENPRVEILIEEIE